MKPEENEEKIEDEDNSFLVVGDVIGDTTYSQRFVLKILLKLANLDILKDEILEKNFEDELCILWDMTAERDVVFFLQNHEFLNLIRFALPVINSSRIIEILIGIVGNMCCQVEVVRAIMNLEGFLSFLFKYAKSDDSLILIQLLRLFNSCLFLSNDNVSVWMSIFQTNEYSPILYFILKNSSNKDLLVTTIEHLNTICTYCNTDENRSDFFTQFVTSEAIESLSAAFKEITIEQRDKVEKNELERVMIITLQIVLNISEFSKSTEIYNDSKEDVLTIISTILCYHDSKFVDEKEIDEDLIDILESIVTITNILKISEICQPVKYFYQSYGMWKALSKITTSDKNNSDNFEEDEKEELQDFTAKLRGPLSKLLCTYIAQCPEEYLLTVFDHVSTEYDDIVSSFDDENLLKAVSKRTENYRIRLEDNVDS